MRQFIATVVATLTLVALVVATSLIGSHVIAGVVLTGAD